MSASRVVPGFVVLCASAAMACGDAAQANPIKATFAQRSPPASVARPLAFRFPDRARQPVRLFDIPAFEELSWRFDDRNLAASSIAGYSSAEDMIFFVSPEGWLRSLELVSGRVRTLDTAVTQVAIGPTSTMFTLRSDNTIARVLDRRMQVWPDTLPETPERFWGTTRERIVTRSSGPEGPILTVISEDGPEDPISIPDGVMAVTEWGDYVAVVSNGFITGIRLSEPALRPTVSFSGTMTSLVFSASGHRLHYVTDRNILHSINRFDFTPVQESTLDGQLAEIRGDPFGRFLLGRTAVGDTLVVLNPADGTRVLTRPTTWTGGLPTTTAAGDIVLRDSIGVKIVDPQSNLEKGQFNEPVGEWIVIPWDPNRPALQLVAETAIEVEEEAADNRVFYAQLGSTSNLAWASDRVRDLTSAGLPARVVMPSEFDDRYRLVLGPYPSRSVAEENARRLGQAYFIISFDRADTSVRFR